MHGGNIIYIHMIGAPDQQQEKQRQLQLLKKSKRRSRNLRQQALFRMHITPREYRGMSFLGSYPDNISKMGTHIEDLRDPRLAQIDPNIFKDKSVLELGAGNGNVAIEVANRMGPSMYTAVEIDTRLYQMAQKRIQRMTERIKVIDERRGKEEIVKQVQKLPLFWQSKFRKVMESCREQRQQEVTEGQIRQNVLLPNLTLVNQNFFNFETEEQFDIIVCFKTTKWVHLALGDDGLTVLFRKIKSLLRPNGLLLLQYPLWPSYMSRRNANAVFRANLKNNKLTIKPEMIPSALKFEGIDPIEEVQGRNGQLLHHPLTIFRKNERRTNQ